MQASIRTPLEVIQLVTEDLKLDPSIAVKVEKRLLSALRCVPGTMLRDENGELTWCHATEEGDIAEKNNRLPSITVRTEEPVETNEKRFYLPWPMLEKLTVRCPKCGEVTYLTGDYLSEPIAGKFDTQTAYCGNDDCGHYWGVRCRLDFELTVEDETLDPDAEVSVGKG